MKQTNQQEIKKYCITSTNDDLAILLNTMKTDSETTPRLCARLVIDTNKRTSGELIEFYAKLLSETNFIAIDILGPELLSPIIKAAENNHSIRVFNIRGNEELREQVLKYCARNRNAQDAVQAQIQQNDETADFTGAPKVTDAAFDELGQSQDGSVDLAGNTADNA